MLEEQNGRLNQNDHNRQCQCQWQRHFVHQSMIGVVVFAIKHLCCDRAPITIVGRARKQQETTYKHEKENVELQFKNQLKKTLLLNRRYVR